MSKPFTPMTITPTPSTARRSLAWDQLKVFGLLLVLVDHAGAFLFPDALWLRGIGRAAMPVFLFLTGFALTYKQDRIMIALGVFVTAVIVFKLGHWFPVDILLTIALCRWLLHIADTRKKPFNPWQWWLLVNIIALPSMLVIGYGSHALMFAFFGYMQRRPERFSRNSRLAFGLLSMIAHAIMQAILFAMPPAVCGLMVLALAVIFAAFWKLPPLITTQMQQAHPTEKPGQAGLQWLGRNCLYLYALHLVALVLWNAQALEG